MIAELIVPIASSTDTAPTARIAAGEEGKSSRVMPTKDTITAQAANSAPKTWKAFTVADPSECVRLLHRVVTDRGGASDNLVWQPMAALLDNVRTAISAPRGGRAVCLVCGRRIGSHEDAERLRGGAIVHRDCAEAARAASASERADRDE
jgi:hypothetical protein